MPNQKIPPWRRENVRALRHRPHDFRLLFDQSEEKNAAENVCVGYSTSRNPVLPKVARQSVDITIVKHLSVRKAGHVLARYTNGASWAPIIRILRVAIPLVGLVVLFHVAVQ